MRPFSGLNKEQWIHLLNFGAVAALVGWLGCLVVLSFSLGWGNDFIHFWGGAKTLLDGGNPYLAIYPYPDLGEFGARQFLPPPWIAVMFLPLACLPFRLAMVVMNLINIGLLSLIIGMIYWMGKGRRPVWSLALIGFAVIFLSVRCVQSGQLGLFVTLGLMLCLRELRRGRWFAAGFWFSLVLVKPWIALGAVIALAVLVVARRQWRFVVAFILVTVVVVSGTTAVWPGWFASYLQVDFRQTLYVVGDNIIQSFPVTTAFDFFTYVLRVNPSLIRDVFIGISLLAAIVPFAGLVMFSWKRKRISDEALIGFASLMGLLIVPYVRYYDFAILVLWMVGIAYYTLPGQTAPEGYKFVWAFVVLALISTAGSHPEPWAFLIPVILYIASWYVLITSARRVSAGGHVLA